MPPARGQEAAPQVGVEAHCTVLEYRGRAPDHVLAVAPDPRGGAGHRLDALQDDDDAKEFSSVD
eukprot:9729572-Lingulodinium_polyedra.AAC.1